MKTYNFTLSDDILANREISSTSKLIYGLIQTMGKTPSITELSSILNTSDKTIRRSLKEIKDMDKNVPVVDKNVQPTMDKNVPVVDKNVHTDIGVSENFEKAKTFIEEHSKTKELFDAYLEKFQALLTKTNKLSVDEIEQLKDKITALEVKYGE